MWNVNRNVDELIKEFNRYCFGEQVGEVLDEMVHFIERHYYHLAFENGEYKRAGLYDVGSPWEKSAETLNVEFVRKVEAYVLKAKALIEQDEMLAQQEKADRLLNLNDVELMVDMMKYLNYDKLWKTTEEEKKAFLQTFYNRVKKTPVLKFGSKWERTVSEEFAQHGIY